MNNSERIPTLHELKLAGRVERAKALFGPGGYLTISENTNPAGKDGPAAAAPPLEHPGDEEGSEEVQVVKTPSATAVKGSQQDGESADAAAKENNPPKEDGEVGQSSQPSSVEHFRLPNTKTIHGSPRPTPKDTLLEGTGEEGSRRARRVPVIRGAATTNITLTIVGGRPNRRGFINLKQSGKVFLGSF